MMSHTCGDDHSKYASCCYQSNFLFIFFFFNDAATTEIYTLSLHDALPIGDIRRELARPQPRCSFEAKGAVSAGRPVADRKSTRLNSSHQIISYAVFCLKKKKKTKFHYFFYKKKKNNINN